jgi:hypothetical protein
MDMLLNSSLFWGRSRVEGRIVGKRRLGDHAPIVGALTGAFREDISRRFIGLSPYSLYPMPWLVMTSLRLCLLGVTAVSHDALGPDTWDLSMVFAPDAPRVVWLFTRGRESVRIEVTAGETGGGRLVVKGPSSKRALYEFADMMTLMEHQAQLEAQLVTTGYTLEQFTSERRRWPR